MKFSTNIPGPVRMDPTYFGVSEISPHQGWSTSWIGTFLYRYFKKGTLMVNPTDFSDALMFRLDPP